MVGLGLTYESMFYRGSDGIILRMTDIGQVAACAVAARAVAAKGGSR